MQNSMNNGNANAVLDFFQYNNTGKNSEKKDK